jgi:hypothetical protein
MQLIDIDKARYRKHLNIVIVGFIASLLVLSLLFGSLFISLFSTVVDSAVMQVTADSVANAATDEVTTEPETNFRYNLLGVILALLANAAILHSIKNSAFFKEIYYVWQIKQLQNLIYRKLKKVKAAGKAGDETALTILSFYYQCQIQVYNLDDNTITLSSIEKHLQGVNDIIASKGICINASQFDKKMITSFKG